MNKSQKAEYERKLKNRDEIILNRDAIIAAGKEENERLLKRIDEIQSEARAKQVLSENSLKILKSSTDQTLRQADKNLSAYLEQIRFLRQALLITGTESGKLTPELLKELSMPVNIMSYTDPMMDTQNYEGLLTPSMPRKY